MRRKLCDFILAGLLLFSSALVLGQGTKSEMANPAVTPAAARAIAKEAYAYGLPLVMGYKALYETAVHGGSPEHQVPLNQIKNEARLYTPADTAIVAPNSDTPYSFAYLDLRSEPVVLSAPHVEAGRYFSVQLIDLYTHNFAYIANTAERSCDETHVENDILTGFLVHCHRRLWTGHSL